MLKKKRLSFVFLASILVAIGCGDPDADETEETTTDADDPEGEETNDEIDDAEPDDETADISGGELNIALNAQPPTLDPHITTSTATRDTARMMYETLMTLDSQYQPVPMLAESYEESDDGLTYTFNLREGVNFHNGEEMTSEDVVASMNRWKENSSMASSVLGDAMFEAEDDYTVTIELEEYSSVAMDVIATPGQHAAIMPAEIIESANPDGVEEHIGTGPYELGEWAQDQHVHFTKYEDYQPVDFEADGLSGHKEALVDDIYFHIVTDSSTRQSGIQSGEYDIAYQIPFDSYEQVASLPDVNVETEFTGSLVLGYNQRERAMADVNMRQAVNAALDMDAILQASLVDEDIYRDDGSYLDIDNELWGTDAGTEAYNINDTELAEAYLEEAGYDGEEIVLLATRDYEHYYNSAVVIQQQLEAIGMNVSVEVYDWPTHTELRSDTSAWDMFVNGHVFRSEPTQLLEFDPDYSGGIEDPKVEELRESIEQAESQEEGFEYWEELQEYAWNDFLSITKLGTYSSVFGVQDHVSGHTRSNGLIIWNTSVDN